MRLSWHDLGGGVCAAVMAPPVQTMPGRAPTILRSGSQVERPNTDPDIELVRRAASGDLGAFETLVTRHQRSVYGIVSRMVRVRDEVDDVVQDVFLLAFRSLGKFRGDAMFSTWLHSIAVNTTLKHLKRSRKWAAPSLDDPEMGLADNLPASTPDPGDQAEANVRHEMIRMEVDRLPDKHKAVLVLYYFEEYSCEEIARVLGCSVGTVWSRLHYACKKLRGKLEWMTGE